MVVQFMQVVIPVVFSIIFPCDSMRSEFSVELRIWSPLMTSEAHFGSGLIVKEIL